MLPLVAGALIGGGASLLGDVGSAMFGQAQAQKQMDFQREMSNTAWQRGVADMRKAGINPMLAFSQGGASAPMGSMAPTPGFGSTIGQTVNSALDARRLSQDIRKQQFDINSQIVDQQKGYSTINLLDRQAEKEAANVRAANANADIAETSADFIKKHPTMFNLFDKIINKGAGSLLNSALSLTQ